MPKKKGSKQNKHWAKYRLEVVRANRGKSKFHWRAIACNGRPIFHSGDFAAEVGPRKTINSFIEAIKKGQYRIVEELV